MNIKVFQATMTPPFWLPMALLVCSLAIPAVAQETLSESEAEDLIEEIKRAAAEAESALKDKTSEHLYSDAVLETADYEATLLLDWVSANTHWTPYSGRLRGSGGVLMDRRGNSLDRAILLSTLLEEAGYETRLARVQLSDESAVALWEREMSEARSRQPGAGSENRTLPLDHDLSEAELTSEVSRIANELEKKFSWSGPAQEKRHQVEAARDHWWVQVKLDQGWEDYDPLFRGDSAPSRGEALSLMPISEIPPELSHGLRLQVVVERFEEGRREEEVALEIELAASEMALDAPIELRFVPHSDSWTDEALDDLTVALSAEHWLPMAQHKQETTNGEWISDRGTLGESPSAFSGKKKLGDATKGLAALGAAKQEMPTESYLTAVWLDYTVIRPGRSDVLVRREITDILGPHRRGTETGSFKPSDDEIRDRGLALMGYTAILPLTSSPAPDAVHHEVLKLWAENRNPFIALVYRAADREDDRVPRALAQFKHKPVDLITIAALRQAWNEHGDQVFLDQVNVLATHYFIKDELPVLERTMGVDVVANGVGVIPDAAVDPRRVRLQQGVLDTYVEGILFASDAALNTFHLSLKQSADLASWPAMGTNDGASGIGMLTPAARARLAEVVKDGNRVVVYPESQNFGNVSFASWWEIDPEDGTTLGRGYRGWGAVLAEKTIRDIPVHTAAKKAAEKTGVTVGCKMAIVATTVAERVVVAKMHAAGQVQLPVRKFQKACYILK